MMAERTVVSRGWCLPVFEQVDVVTAAALLSACLALTWRAHVQPGQMVLILGATGVAGQLAVQIAKHLGAERVVAAGRNRRLLTTLPDLGADATIALDLSDQELTAAFIREAGPRRFDVVLDLCGVIRRKSCSRPSLVML
jgi:NADPH2:quinone reductase